MKESNSKNRIFNCLSGSILIHGTLAVGLVLAAPHLSKIPEAISGEFIEFESSAPNVGNIVEVAIAETPKSQAPIVKKKVAAPKVAPKIESPEPEVIPVVKVKKEKAPVMKELKEPATTPELPAKEVVAVKPEKAPNTIDDGQLPAELQAAQEELDKTKAELEQAKIAAEKLRKSNEHKKQLEAIKLEAENARKEKEAFAAAQAALAEKAQLERAQAELIAKEKHEAEMAAAREKAAKAQAEALALKERLAEQQAQAAAAKRNAEIEKQLARKAGPATSGGAGNAQSFYDLRQAPGNIPPHYTSQARMAKEQGRGQLYYFVTKSGQVTKIRLTQTTGSVNLDNLAVNAFSKYKFVPGQEGWTVHNFEFNLKGAAQPQGGRLRTSN